MCESTVYVKSNGEKIEIMANVAIIHLEDDKIVCVDIMGKRKELKNKIREIDCVNHEIILAQ